MATSPRRRLALLVIDVQEAVMEGAHERDEVIGRINTLIERARAAAIPIVFIQHDDPTDPSMVADSDGWQLVADLDVGTHDVRIPKQFRDSFANTTLRAHLESLAVDEVIITGAQSDYCVHATTTGALREGYDVTVVSDAHTTSAPKESAISAADVVTFVNTNLTWLTYPEREMRVLPAVTVLR
jgi:nicotinamidase-related amidase